MLNNDICYRYIKKFQVTNDRIGPLRFPDGSLTNDPLSMANLLQDQFCSAFSDPSNNSIVEPEFDIYVTTL